MASFNPANVSSISQPGAHRCLHWRPTLSTRRQSVPRSNKSVVCATDAGVLQRQDVLPAASAEAALRQGAASTSSAVRSAGQAEEGAGPSLSDQLRQCRCWQDVLHTVVQNAADVDSHEVAVALKVLATMSRSGGRSTQEDIVKHPDFKLLLRRGLVVMYGCENKDLANTLWSLATLRHNDVSLMSVLIDQASRVVMTLNPKDLALITWAFGTLRATPGQLLNDLAAVATQKIDGFEPQGLSMLCHSFAALEHTSTPLMMAVAQRMEDTLPAFQSQAVANIMLALGKLKFTSAPLCAAVDQHVAERISEYRPQEVCNLLWAYVHFGYVPFQTLDAVQAAYLSQGLVAQLKAVDCAALIWAFASLGFQPQPALVEGLCETAAGQLGFMKQQELCNMLWGLAMLGCCEVPMFQMLVDAIVSAYNPRRPDPRALRQLFQARMLAEACGVDFELPQELRETAAACWMQSVLGNPMSTSHRNISHFMRRLRLPHVPKQPTADGLLSVDIALQPNSEQPVAIQVIGPHETSINGGQPLGQALSEKRLLEARGWAVVYLPTSRWPPKGSSKAKQALLAELLSPHGIEVPQHEMRKQTKPGDAAKRAPRREGSGFSRRPRRVDPTANTQSLPDVLRQGHVGDASDAAPKSAKRQPVRAVSSNAGDAAPAVGKSRGRRSGMTGVIKLVDHPTAALAVAVEQQSASREASASPAASDEGVERSGDGSAGSPSSSSSASMDAFDIITGLRVTDSGDAGSGLDGSIDSMSSVDLAAHSSSVGGTSIADIMSGLDARLAASPGR